MSDKDLVKDAKLKAFCEPCKLLYPGLMEQYPEVHDFFCYLLQLDYADEPDYDYLASLLVSMRKSSAPKPTSDGSQPVSEKIAQEQVEIEQLLVT